MADKSIVTVTLRSLQRVIRCRSFGLASFVAGNKIFDRPRSDLRKPLALALTLRFVGVRLTVAIARSGAFENAKICSQSLSVDVPVRSISWP